MLFYLDKSKRGAYWGRALIRENTVFRYVCRYIVGGMCHLQATGYYCVTS